MPDSVSARCEHCDLPRREHLAGGCPDRTGYTFKYKRVTSRVSASFSAEEIELLHVLLSTLLRGGDVRGLIRHKSFARVYAAAQRLRERLESQRSEVMR